MWRAPSWLLHLIAIIVAITPGCALALPLGSPAAVNRPVGSPSDLAVAEVYRRAALALDRPGLLYRATIQAESDGAWGHVTNAITQWADARRQVAREDYLTRREQESGPPTMGRQTTLLTDRARYTTGGPGGQVYAAPACRGATVAAAAALGCPPDPRFSPATLTVEDGAFAGQPAVVLVTTGPLGGESRGTLTTRLYLDPATCLPVAAEGEGRGEVAAQGTWLVRQRATYAHEFIPVAAVPADYFDPAALGYVAPGDDIARPVPAFPDFRAYWLGERFAGAGTLPPLAPGRVDRPMPPGGGPGYQFILSYGRAEEPFGLPLLTLQEWPRATWDAFLAQAHGSNFWDGPCVTREELTLPEGRALLFSGYAAGPSPVSTGVALGAPGCPAGPPDTFLAHAYLGQTVLLIYAAAAGLPDGTTIISPYNTRAGIGVVLRALRSRQPCASPCPPPGAPQGGGAGPRRR